MKDYLEVLLLALLGIGPIYQNVVKGNQDKFRIYGLERSFIAAWKIDGAFIRPKTLR